MTRVVGRFAPSPTGRLHAGSLLAALGSYLSARHAGGAWHLRIENIDPPREMPGAADDFLRQLEAHGLHWDGEVVLQADRRDAHEALLAQLRTSDRVYACQCSRSALQAAGRPDCLGPCRQAGLQEGAWRLRAPDHVITYHDRLRGLLQEDLRTTCGDAVLKRRDGFIAYQLAVVADDAALGVTEVVRGADLLDNTARQVWLQQCLGLPTPDYLHLPLIRGSNGRKLSKQNFAQPLDASRAARNLHEALTMLGQCPPADLANAPAATLLSWATAHWSVASIPRDDAPA